LFSYFISPFSFTLIGYRSIISFLIPSVIVILCTLIISARQPFDLSEAESELIGGFLTDFSGCYYLLSLLIEYANIIYVLILFLILLIIDFLALSIFITLISLSRSLFARFRFDTLIYVS
jgi:NADH:ubiquinone oxidoreductase subunit H